MGSWILRALVAAWLGCVLWLALALPALAEAAVPPLIASGQQPLPLQPHSRSWIDAQANYRVADVEALAEQIPWRPRRPEQIDRIDGKALWIQFDAQVADASRWYLEVGAAGIDRIQLFYRGPNGDWVVREAGDRQPVASWPLPGRHPTFQLAPTQGQPTRYWLRIENSWLDFGAPLTLYPERLLAGKREREEFLLGAYFGVAALLVLASLANAAAYRDRAFLAFGIYLGVVGASQLARVGVGAEHIWQDWPYWNDIAWFAWPGLPVAAALWFVRVVTEPARLSPTLDNGVWGLVAAVLLAVAANAVLHTRLSMSAVLGLTGLSIAAVAAMVIWGCLDGRDPTLKLVALSFLPLLVLAPFPLARAFNLIPTSALTRNAVFYGTVLQMPLLYYALQMRSVRRHASEARAAALSRTDALTGLPHRRALVERLDASLTRARATRQLVALLGVRVANLPALAEEFGREAANKALVVTASHLKRAITDTGLAARVGDNEFALLLEAPVTAEGALSRAQQVVASGLRHTAALPPAMTLRFQVTVALVPHEELDGGASVQWVLEGLNQFEPEARKLIRHLNF